MEMISPVEWLGYIASAFIAVSFMMKDIMRLRLLNFTGCSLFVIYGNYISAWPVAGMNAFVACINLYHIIKIYRERSNALTVAK
ncbi:YgjV family protein [Shewanella eurypsychrophilus]|uniref:YgjV family protein n=1 Tax=Shewanella eurypsychrophilus TaxID=2593656 RepID=A0ABX6VB28_9GAMM|nr:MULTISPECIES: YgjV family protein [Shewanella]QFU24619.1 uroporphyrinogen decarboxylase [Shewanella sp. YLB-09]QPG59816.1 YgjV family protein [Shewanella eurypsychrophilus]